MICFSEEKVLLLHQLIIAETGGNVELRDIGLLDSALEGCFQSFGGQELYPTKKKRVHDWAIWTVPQATDREIRALS